MPPSAASGFPIRNRKHAFRLGLVRAFQAPAWIMFAGMMGVGAVGKSHGFDEIFVVATSFFLFAQPGQIVLMEMLLTSAAVVPVVLAVGLTSARFFVMTLALFPLLPTRRRNWRTLPASHLVTMTTWTLCISDIGEVPVPFRWHFYLGACMPCFLAGLPGTWLGYQMAGQVPEAITLMLVMLNPLFFVVTFAAVKLPVNRWAALFGAVLMLLLSRIDPATSLLLTALIGGTLAYGIQRQIERRRATAKAVRS